MSQTKLYGLVLAGGKSKRMGKDKGKLVYHNTPQRQFAYNLLESHCEKTFLSIRSDQIGRIDKTINTIVDQNKHKGPFNGILSAHDTHSDVAWLVMATDLPLLSDSDIKRLIEERNQDKFATAYATRESGLPEPMIAIWEPRGLNKAMEYLAFQDKSCPRRFLINNDVELIYPKNDSVLMNANTIEDFKRAKLHISTS